MHFSSTQSQCFISDNLGNDSFKGSTKSTNVGSKWEKFWSITVGSKIKTFANKTDLRIYDFALGAMVSLNILLLQGTFFKDAQILTRMADQVRPVGNPSDERAPLLILYLMAFAGAVYGGISGSIMRKISSAMSTNIGIEGDENATTGISHLADTNKVKVSEG